MKKVLSNLLLCCFFGSLLLLGCGGGGGGGGGVTGPTTTDTTTSTATSTGTGDGALITGITKPNSFSSAAFPATSQSLTIPAANGNRALILVNNGSTAQVAVMAGTTAGFAAAVRKKAPEDVQINPALKRAVFSKEAHDFHQSLRDLEKRLPAPTGVSQNRIPRAGVRASDSQGDVKTFKIFISKNSSTQVTATNRLRVTLPDGSGWINYYLDSQISYTSDAQNFINTLKSAWDKIYPTDRSYFGVEPPSGYNGIIDSDISVLISPAIDTAGFFYSGDLYAPSQVEGGISNERKMFYLRYNPTDIPASILASTMAHEFQHMINYYQRKLNGVSEEDWLNEAMSGYAEHINGYAIATSNQSKAIQANKFFESVNSFQLNADPWPSSLDADASYGQVYLFGVWLGQQFGNGGSVVSMLNSTNVGKNAVAAIAKDSFDKVFAQWMVALRANEYGLNTRYGYPDINLTGTMHYGAGLRDITLTGPFVYANNGAFPYNSGTLTIRPYTSAYVELTGQAGSPLFVTLPAKISTFEIHNP